MNKIVISQLDKKPYFFSCVVFMVVFCALLFSKSYGQSIQYIGNLYDVSGNPVPNKSISVQASISYETALIYREQHGLVTDQEGYFFIQLGQGIASVGMYNAIQWGLGAHSLQIAIDTVGSGVFISGPSKPFTYVPFALYADSASEIEPLSFYELQDSPQGNNTGDMLYWQGEWKILPIGSPHDMLKIQDSIPGWFDTEQMPVVQTHLISQATSTSANCGGGILSDGGSPITQKGICFSRLPNADITDSIIQCNAAGSSFTMALFPLQPSTTYFVRAFASNELGIAYGAEYTFTTLGEPVVATGSVTGIIYNRAIVEGVISSDGGSSILQCGICYATTSSPTINDKFAPATPGIGSFFTTVGGLSPMVTYYARAFVRTQAGTYYGNELSFTSANWSCGDSLTYYHLAVNNVAPEDKLVTYGTLANVTGVPNTCWLTRNLGASRQANAITDASPEAAGWYWQFNRKYGYKNDGSATTPTTFWLPNILEENDWLSAKDPCTLELGNGWRIPDIAEYYNLLGYNNWQTQPNLAWTSDLKFHYAGYLTQALTKRGVEGHYWVQDYSNYDSGSVFKILTTSVVVAYDNKKWALPLRCIKNL